MEKLMTIKALESLGISKGELRRQIREATRQGKESEKYEPRTISARFENGRTIVELTTGWNFDFDSRVFPAFRGATNEEIADVRPIGMGYTLEWPTLDQHLGVGGLVLKPARFVACG